MKLQHSFKAVSLALTTAVGLTAALGLTASVVLTAASAAQV